MKQTVLGFIIVLLCVISYANTFGNEFVWDEKVFVQDNLKIRSLGNIPGFFSQTEDNLYRPLRTTLYAFTYSVWEQNVFGYHLNSLVFHTLSALMVFLIVERLSRPGFIPFVTACIFAVHPIHTERVTNMTGGFDLLGIFLLLAAFYFYIVFSQTGKSSLALISGFIFGIGLFASEEVFVFPLLVLLYEFVFNKPELAKKTHSIGSYFAVLAVFLFFRFNIIGLGARAASYPTGSFFTTLITMPKVIMYYLFLIFIPYPMTLYRQIETSNSFFDLILILSILILGFVFLLAFKIYKKHPLISFSAGWFFITLLPFSNILPLQALMADRYLYLPSLGAAIVISYMIFTVPKNRIISLGLSLIIVASFLLVTIDRNSDWKNNVALWEATAKTSSDSTVYSNLGFSYEKDNQLIKAKAALKKAIDIDFRNHKAHYNLGIVHLREKDYENAALEFLHSTEIDPSYAMAYDSLGLTYYYSDQLGKAVKAFEKGIEADPKYYKTYSDLGIVEAQLGNFSTAILLFSKSLELNKWNHEAYYNLGVIYEFLGNQKASKENFLRALELKPGNKLYQKKLGV